MNLIPVLTGDVRPTCDANGVHTPFIMYIEGQPVRFIIRPNLPLHLMVAWVCSDVAKALGAKKHWNAGESLNLIEGEDKGADTIVTLGGPQRLRVFTSKGLTKFLMKSRHPAAESFCDELAKKNDDLMYYGIAFRGSLSVTDVIAALKSQFNEQIQAFKEEISSLRREIAAQPRPVFSDPIGSTSLHPYSREEVQRLGEQGFWQTREWLRNQRVPSSELLKKSASMVAQARAFFRAEDQLRNKMTRTLRRPNRSGKRVWLIHEKYLDAFYYGDASAEAKESMRRYLDILKRDDLRSERGSTGDQLTFADVIDLSSRRPRPDGKGK